MKIHLEKAIFINRAPFDKLELDFNANEIAVLSSVNGKGKTTILSHIIDAFYEMAKLQFHNEFQGKKDQFYRVVTTSHNLQLKNPSFVYLRFKTSDELIIDYVDINSTCTAEDYNVITLDNKIPFSGINQKLPIFKNAKFFSQNLTPVILEAIFDNNILTYFPAYRFEIPGYLNEPYKTTLDFKKKSNFVGYLKNPLEVISGLPQLANWVMDVILDVHRTKTQTSIILITNIDNIISESLKSKNIEPVRVDVGQRNFGNARIQVGHNTVDVDGQQIWKQVYPSIFNMSSGESALLCIFGELLRQADNLKYDIFLNNITGIVLIDEVDKHLHIKLQKEILPKLFKLFPNVQFIISSHSPFLSMGLAQDLPARSKIIDLDNCGVSRDPTTNELYTEVYDMMINENNRFKDMYQFLKTKITEGTKPLIITEGKTDIQHLKKAKEKLAILDCDIEFYEINGTMGDKELLELLNTLSKIQQKRKIIGIFDRDTPTTISKIEGSSSQDFKSYGNNVYAFCIPIPTGRESYTNISIEFYYNDIDLKKEKNGKKLYFDNELNFDRKGKPISPRRSPSDNLEKKICDYNIGGLDWIHSKSRFAELIETDTDFISEFDFNNFQLIFDKIKSIIAQK